MDALTRDLIWVMPTEGDHFARLNAVMPSGVAAFFGWNGGVFMSGMYLQPVRSRMPLVHNITYVTVKIMRRLSQALRC